MVRLILSLYVFPLFLTPIRVWVSLKSNIGSILSDQASPSTLYLVHSFVQFQPRRTTPIGSFLPQMLSTRLTRMELKWLLMMIMNERMNEWLRNEITIRPPPKSKYTTNKAPKSTEKDLNEIRAGQVRRVVWRVCNRTEIGWNQERTPKETVSRAPGGCLAELQIHCEEGLW